MKDLIKKLTEAYGPSGNEGQVRELIRKEIRGLSDSVSTDVLGNLVAARHPRGRTAGGRHVMVAAHMDEIGFIVTHVEDSGFVRFSNIGGINPNNILAQRVVFENGTLGLIGEEKQDNPQAARALEKMFLDIGAKDKRQAEKMVKVGDIAAFHQGCRFLGGRAVAKSMDDRIGCAAVILAMRRLKNSPHRISFVFTAQEEVGLRGATAAAYGLDPDLGLAVDITGAFDAPGEKPKLPSVLGEGAAIKVKDAGILAHPGVRRLLVDTAKRKRIPHQPDILERGMTDGAAIYKTRAGIPTGVISIPTRYGHSCSEMVDLGDVRAAADLLAAVLSSPVSDAALGLQAGKR
jgi:endoglucanase